MQYFFQILMKWGEYSSDVQFILQRSEGRKQLQHTQQNQSKHVQLMPCNNSTEEHNMIDNQTIDLERPRSTRKSFTFGYMLLFKLYQIDLYYYSFDFTYIFLSLCQCLN